MNTHSCEWDRYDELNLNLGLLETVFPVSQKRSDTVLTVAQKGNPRSILSVSKTPHYFFPRSKHHLHSFVLLGLTNVETVVVKVIKNLVQKGLSPGLKLFDFIFALGRPLQVVRDRAQVVCIFLLADLREKWKVVDEICRPLTS